MLKRLFLLTLILLLGACTAAPTATAEPPTAVPTVGPTATPATPLVILILPSDMKPEQSQEYQTATYEMAQANGYRFMVLNKLEESVMEPALKIVITLVPQDDLATLISKAPQATFLAVGIKGVKEGGNVSILGDGDTSIDKIAFIAGVIAATVTEDYHTGALIKKEDQDGQVVANSFKAGQQYFCGLCNHVLDPFTFYPSIQDIPSDAKPNEYGAYGDILVRNRVETIFIQPGLDIPELIEAMKGSSAMMIGTQTPAGNVPGWVVTIKPDYLQAFKQTFPDLVAGSAGKRYDAPVSFIDANENLFGKGKQEYVKGILKLVMAGKIATDLK